MDLFLRWINVRESMLKLESLVVFSSINLKYKYLSKSMVVFGGSQRYSKPSPYGNEISRGLIFANLSFHILRESILKNLTEICEKRDNLSGEQIVSLY